MLLDTVLYYYYYTVVSILPSMDMSESAPFGTIRISLVDITTARIGSLHITLFIILYIGI